MNNNKRNILVNILVICLYFLWPYFLNSIIQLEVQANSYEKLIVEGEMNSDSTSY